MTPVARGLVVDASAMVDLLLGTPLGASVRLRLEHQALHAPAHIDAEVLSALGRLHRADKLSAPDVRARLGRFAAAPISRHSLESLIEDAWSLRQNLRLVDALYAALSAQLELPLITTDGGLGAAFPRAELVVG
ncbi:MAG: type II toxin-antitoxin system VapC family toxin [Holophagales bacterium]|nr:type II toxin-antitoxin system VapC family toxin [Holophagales bacterium]